MVLKLQLKMSGSQFFWDTVYLRHAVVHCSLLKWKPEQSRHPSESQSHRSSDVVEHPSLKDEVNEPFAFELALQCFDATVVQHERHLTCKMCQIADCTQWNIRWWGLFVKLLITGSTRFRSNPFGSWALLGHHSHRPDFLATISVGPPVGRAEGRNAKRRRIGGGK